MTKQTAEISPDLYDVKLLKETLLFAVICAKKELNPQEAINRCSMLSGRWVFVPATDDVIKNNWDDPDHPEHAGIYPTPCTEHPDTHVHILANC